MAECRFGPGFPHWLKSNDLEDSVHSIVDISTGTLPVNCTHSLRVQCYIYYIGKQLNLWPISLIERHLRFDVLCAVFIYLFILSPLRNSCQPPHWSHGLTRQVRKGRIISRQAKILTCLFFLTTTLETPSCEQSCPTHFDRLCKLGWETEVCPVMAHACGECVACFLLYLTQSDMVKKTVAFQRHLYLTS